MDSDTPSLKAETIATDPSGRNVSRIYCPSCDTIIIKEGVAALVERPMDLHRLTKASGTESILHHWLVSDKFDFENIAVSKPFSASSATRYLCCGNCDIGPLGIWFPDVDANAFFLADSRVRHKNPVQAP